jgi:hypothetical protein
MDSPHFALRLMIAAARLAKFITKRALSVANLTKFGIQMPTLAPPAQNS